MKIILFLVISLLSLFFPYLLTGSEFILNIPETEEPIYYDFPYPPFDVYPGWKNKLKIIFGGVVYAGNVQTITGIYGINFTSTDRTRWEFEIEAEGRYGESSGKKTTNRHKLSFNPDFYLLDDNITLFYIGMIETQEFNEIYLRTTHQMGVRLKFDPIWWLTFYLSFSPLLWEYEENWEREKKKDIFRLSFRPRLVLNLTKDKKSFLWFTIYYLPKFFDGSNYKVTIQILFKFQINKLLLSETKFQMDYISIPIETTLKKRDYSLITSIGIEI